MPAPLRVAPESALLVALALGGMAISSYLTTVHYARAPLVCSVGRIVDCAGVTASPYSLVPGTQVPITIPGMLWFLASGALAVLVDRQRAAGGPWAVRLCLAHLAWGAAGLLAVLYLAYVEIVRLHAICEWCTAVHLLALLTFLVALYWVQRLPVEDPGG